MSANDNLGEARTLNINLSLNDAINYLGENKFTETDKNLNCVVWNKSHFMEKQNNESNILFYVYMFLVYI